MSKTQDKREARRKEAAEFVQARRAAQLKMFEEYFLVGMTVYEANKEKMSAEEIELIEAEIEKNKQTIEDFKKEWGLE